MRRFRARVQALSGPLHAPQRYFTDNPSPDLGRVSIYFTVSVLAALTAFLITLTSLPGVDLTVPQGLQLALLALPLVALQVMIGSLTLYRFMGRLGTAVHCVLWSWTPLGIIGILGATLAGLDLTSALVLAVLATPIWAIAIVTGALRAWQVPRLSRVVLLYLSVVYIAPNVLVITTFALAPRFA